MTEKNPNKMSEKGIENSMKESEKKTNKNKEKIEEMDKKRPTEKKENIKQKEKGKSENKENKKGTLEKNKDSVVKEKNKFTLKHSKVIINIKDLPISTKHSVAICKFIKNKKISQAISDLEEVIRIKKAIPMKGEIPHRKGKIMSGRYPKKAAKNFVNALKSLSGNAIHGGIENPIIISAIANQGARPYGRFGRVKKKRTSIKIIAKELNLDKKSGKT